METVGRRRTTAPSRRSSSPCRCPSAKAFSPPRCKRLKQSLELKQFLDSSPTNFYFFSVSLVATHASYATRVRRPRPLSRQR